MGWYWRQEGSNVSCPSWQRRAVGDCRARRELGRLLQLCRCQASNLAVLMSRTTLRPVCDSTSNANRLQYVARRLHLL